MIYLAASPTGTPALPLLPQVRKNGAIIPTSLAAEKYPVLTLNHDLTVYRIFYLYFFCHIYNQKEHCLGQSSAQT
jgi:hypothetical protein